MYNLLFHSLKKLTCSFSKRGTQGYYISATELYTALPIFLFLKKAWHFVLEKGKIVSSQQ